MAAARLLFILSLLRIIVYMKKLSACLCAFLFNLIFDRLSGWPVANLMFLSKDFPGTPVSLLYRIAGPVFPVAMWLLQSFVPFYLVYAVYRLFARQATPTEAPDAVSAAGAEQSP